MGGRLLTVALAVVALLGAAGPAGATPLDRRLRRRRSARRGVSYPGAEMANAPTTEPTPQRLAAVRDQLTLLADYL